MSELIPINILIGDRTYRIKTESENEETIRKNLKLINDKILEYKIQFAGKDMQDYIAMVIIWFATQNADTENGALSKELSEALLKMEEQLDNL